MKFIMYVVELLKVNGRAVIIVPRSNFNNTTKQVNTFKREFLKHVRLIKLYNLNSKVFYPMAGIECVILVFEKVDKSLDEQTLKQIDYRDDGYDISKKLRIKTHEPIIHEYEKQVKYNDDWNICETINVSDIFKNIKLKLVENTVMKSLIKIKSEIINDDTVDEYIDIKDIVEMNEHEYEMKRYKIDDLFVLLIN